MIEEDLCPGVGHVSGGGEQDDVVGGPELEEVLGSHECGRLSQFGVIPADELLETRDVVPIPATELAGWSHILEPLVETGIGLAHAPWPETIDQDPVAPRARSFVDSMDAERHVSPAKATDNDD